MGALLHSLAWIVLYWLISALPAFAVARQVQVCVEDERGAAIPGARVQVQGSASVVSGTGGCAVVDVETKSVLNISREGFAPAVQTIADESKVVVVMRVEVVAEEIEVTAARSPLA